MNRRGFLGSVFGLATAGYLPSLPALPIATMDAPVTYSMSLSEMIAATLRARRHELIANITQTNALLRKLKERT